MDSRMLNICSKIGIDNIVQLENADSPTDIFNFFGEVITKISFHGQVYEYNETNMKFLLAYSRGCDVLVRGIRQKFTVMTARYIAIFELLSKPNKNIYIISNTDTVDMMELIIREIPIPEYMRSKISVIGGKIYNNLNNSYIHIIPIKEDGTPKRISSIQEPDLLIVEYNETKDKLHKSMYPILPDLKKKGGQLILVGLGVNGDLYPHDYNTIRNIEGNSVPFNILAFESDAMLKDYISEKSLNDIMLIKGGIDSYFDNVDDKVKYITELKKILLNRTSIIETDVYGNDYITMDKGIRYIYRKIKSIFNLK